MKILYFYQYFTLPSGSYSTRVYEFARRWVKAGDSVTVITSVYDRSGIEPHGLISRLNVDGIDVRMINIRLSNKHGRALRLLTFILYCLIACWYAVVMPADVVVASSGPLTVGLPGLVARFLRRRPFVFEVRDIWPEYAIQLGVLRNGAVIRLSKMFARICYLSASRVIALSEGMADWIKENHGISNVDVVPNASDNDLIANIHDSIDLPSWTDGKHLVIYTGALGLANDCSQILEVARVTQGRGIEDIEFVIIGEGKERARLEERARDLKLNNLHILDPMPKETVMRWLQRARCFIFTLKNVPFSGTASPNKVFDAFAAGLPVVQATRGWIERLIERQQCGITVPPDDPESMADAVVLLARDSSLRETLAVNARAAAKNLFDRSLLAVRMRSSLATAAGQARAVDEKRTHLSEVSDEAP